MSIEQSIINAKSKRRDLNSAFAVDEVKLSKNAEIEHHSQITGIKNGVWQASLPGGGKLNRITSYSSSSLAIGQSTSMAKSSGQSSINFKPVTAQFN